GWACPRRAPGRTPLRPTATSPQGCARAAGGTGSSRARVGSRSRVPPGLAAERERGDARGDGPLAHAHRDGAAGLGVLPPHERERDRPPEAERPGGARHPPDRGAISEDVGAVRWHHVALEHETHTSRPPVSPPPVASRTGMPSSGALTCDHGGSSGLTPASRSIVAGASGPTSIRNKVSSDASLRDTFSAKR